MPRTVHLSETFPESLYIDRFQDERANEFLCAICLEVHLNNIYELPCGHLFCKQILDPQIKDCPTCKFIINFDFQIDLDIIFLGRKSFKRTTVKKSYFAEKVCKSLKLKCEYCDWIGTRREEKQHLKECYWGQVIECPIKVTRMNSMIHVLLAANETFIFIKLAGSTQSNFKNQCCLLLDFTGF